MRVIILGGGGFRVPLIARELAGSGLPVGELVLTDTDPGRLKAITAVLDDLVGGRFRVTGTPDLDAAVRGADFIFSALRVGGVDGRVRDERTALELGVIGQETVGAGGLSSAARAIPVVDAIARRIRELAPRAWVISMTNPAGIVTEVMARTLGKRVIGVCDSPVGLIRRACGACGIDPGPSLGAVAGRVEAGYLGINHLGWLRSLTVEGTDRLPDLLADAPRLGSFEEGKLFGPDIVRALGALPNEYLYWYYAGAESLRDVIAAGRTRGEHVRDRQREFYGAVAAHPDPARLWREANEERNRSYFAELRTGEKAGERDEADIAAGGYESVALALAQALAGGPEARLILNVRNGATIAGLDEETAVEVPCRVTADGAVPLPAPAALPHELGLMASVRGCERDIAAASLTGSRADARDLALRAFTAHPLVQSLTAARALAEAAVMPS